MVWYWYIETSIRTCSIGAAKEHNVNVHACTAYRELLIRHSLNYVHYMVPRVNNVERYIWESMYEVCRGIHVLPLHIINS